MARGAAKYQLIGTVVMAVLSTSCRSTIIPKTKSKGGLGGPTPEVSPSDPNAGVTPSEPAPAQPPQFKAPTTTVTTRLASPALALDGKAVLAGGASSEESTIATVEVSLRAASGKCLDAAKAGFGAECPVWHETPYSEGWSLGLPVALFQDGTFRVAARAVDARGIRGESTEADWTWDGTPPEVKSLALKGGTAAVRRDQLAIVEVSDSATPVATLRITETLGACDSRLEGSDWQPFKGNDFEYPVRLSFFTGTKKLCLEAKDEAGNVSVFAASGLGSMGVDKAVIEFTQSPPPQFTALDVVSVSGDSAPAGQSLSFSWAATSTAGFGSHPLRSVQWSTDGVAWAALPGLSPADFGTTGSPVTSVAGTFQAPSPTSLPVRFRAFLEDGNGSRTMATTRAFNAAGFNAFAGTFTGDAYQDVTADATILYPLNPAHGRSIIYSKRTGDLYFNDSRRGIMRIRRSDGGVEHVVRVGTGPLAPYGKEVGQTRAASYLREDSRGWIYFIGENGMYRFDPAGDPKAIEPYFSGGTKVADATTASELALFSASLPFAFDASDNLYLGLAPSSTVSSVRYLAKVHRAGVNAGSVTLLAGNGNAGTPTTGGSDPLTQPFINLAGYFWNLAANHDGSVIYFLNYVGSYKLVNGLLYSSAVPVSTTPNLAFRADDPDGKPFYFQTSGSIVKFAAATAGDGGEAFTNVLGGGSASDCHLDGMSATTSCPFGSDGFTFDEAGQLIYGDATIHNMGGGHLSIRVLKSGSVKTIAGLPGINSPTKSRLLLDAALMGDITQDSASNVYFTSATSGHILKINAATGVSSVVAGTGNLLRSLTVGQAAATEPLGTPYGGGNIYSIGVDKANDRLYFRSSNRLYYIDGAGLIQSVGSGGNNWEAMANGTLGSTGTPLWVNLGSGGMTFDGTGSLFLSGAYNSGAAYSAPRVVKVQASDGALTNLAGARSGAGGTASNVMSADGAVASTSSIRCDATGTWNLSQLCSSPATVYQSGNLYFAEFDRVRVLSAIDGSATLDTLKDGDNVAVTDLAGPGLAFSEGIRRFVIVGSRLYYLRDNVQGALFCRWLGTAATRPADCQNTPMAIPGVLTGAFQDQVRGGLVYDATQQRLLIRSGLSEVISYRVPP